MSSRWIARVVTGGVALAALAACSSAEEGTESAPSALTAAEKACVNPPKRSCDFYATCLERDHACGKSGYALGYGDRYCRRFLASRRFSEKGLVWRDETMRCLQKRLGRFLGDRSVSCEQITDGAFDDHPACYTQPQASICDLPFTDWLEVVATIDLGDLLSGRGRKQMAATAGTCAKGWLTPPWMRGSGAAAAGGAAIAGGAAAASDGATFRTPSAADAADVAAKLAIARALSEEPDVALDRLRNLADAASVEAVRIEASPAEP